MSLAESFPLEVVVLTLLPSFQILLAHSLKYLLEAMVCLCRFAVKFSHFSIPIFYFLVLFLKTGLIAQSCFHVTVQLRVTLNFYSPCLYLPSAGPTDAC